MVHTVGNNKTALDLHKPEHPVSFLMILLWIGCIAIAQPTLATTNDDAAREAERLQRLQQERIEQERREVETKRPRTTLEFVAPRTSIRGDPAACHDVKDIIVEGVEVLEQEHIQRLLAPFIDQCLNAADIERLMGEITRVYIERGFIATRVYIQPQDLSNGILRLLVIEGQLEKVLLEDGNRDSVNLATAFPKVANQPFNLRDFEQGLDQINRLPSNSATMKIDPGETTGGSIVRIYNQPQRRQRRALTYDDYGSEATGKGQAGFSFSWDNPLRLNDLLSITHRRSTHLDFSSKHSRSNAYYYSVPLGYSTITLSHVWSDYASTIALPGGDLLANGDAENTALKFDHVIYRDQINRVSLYYTLTKKKNRNYLNDQLLSVASRRLSTVDLGTSWNTKWSGGVLGLSATHTWGTTAFDALNDPPDLPDNAPHAQYRKWNYSGYWHKNLTLGPQTIKWKTSLSGQQSSMVLYGTEQFSIGSLYTVRGFRDTSIAGDTGYYWRNDLAMPFYANIDGTALTIEPYIGMDYGEIRDHYDEVGGHLAGIAAGLTVSTQPYLTAEFMAARPLSLSGRLDNEGTQVFIKLNVDF